MYTFDFFTLRSPLFLKNNLKYYQQMRKIADTVLKVLNLTYYIYPTMYT